MSKIAQRLLGFLLVGLTISLLLLPKTPSQVTNQRGPAGQSSGESANVGPVVVGEVVVPVLSPAVRDLPDGAKEPWNGRELFCRLHGVQDQGGSNEPVNKNTPVLTHGLWPIAPGVYQAELPAPEEGVYRLELLEHEKGKPAGDLRTLDERFVTVPYAPELRKFGSDRIAMTDWTRTAGGGSRVINNPEKDFSDWVSSLEARRAYTNLRPYLLILAAILLVAEAGYRLRLRA